jgi:hypothetical protein
MSNDQGNDPLNFMRNMWGNMGFTLPGMVTPTFDVDELDKRIKDMKAVEGWLRMNLSMLQMTIQSLEMQRTTVSAVQTMSKMATDTVKSMSAGGESEAAPAADTSPLSEAAMWPWQMMQQMREQMQHTAEAAAAAVSEAATEKAAEKPAAKRAKKD